MTCDEIAVKSYALLTKSDENPPEMTKQTVITDESMTKFHEGNDEMDTRLTKPITKWVRCALRAGVIAYVFVTLVARVSVVCYHAGMATDALSESATVSLLERLRALHEVRNLLLRVSAVDDVCRLAVELGRTKLGFDRLSIWFADGPERIRGAFGVDETGAVRDERRHRRDIGPGSLMGRVLRGDDELIVEVNDTLRDDQFHAVGQGIHALAALTDGEQVLGAVSADNFLTQRPWTDDDSELLQLYASTLAHLIVQKRTEAALRLSEQTYREIFDAAGDALFVHDEAGHIVDINARACAQYGYDRETALTYLEDAAAQSAPPYSLIEAQEFMRRAREEGPQTFEWRSTRANSEPFWSEVSLRACTIAGQSRVIASVRDISERKQAAAQIEMLQQAIDIHTDAVYWFSTDNRFTYVNAASCATLGYTRDELLGMHISQVTPKAADEHMQRVWETLRSQGAFHGESEHRRKDGSVFPVEISTTYVQFGGQEFACGFARDISERLQAEQALREREEQYRSLFATMTEGMALHELITDVRGRPVDYRILAVNPAFGRHTALQAEQIVGELASACYGMSTAPYLAEYARVVASGEPFTFETYFPPIKRHFRITAYCTHPGQFATIFEDISARKTAEDAMRASEERYRTIFENIQDVFYQTDMFGRLTNISPSIERYSGYAPQELIGRFITDMYVHPEDRELMTEVMRERGEAVDFVVQLVTKDEDVLDFSINAHFLYDAEQYPVGVEGMLRDVTARNRAERELAEEKERLRVMVRSIGDGVIATDTGGYVVMMNRVAEALTGWSQDDALDRPLTEVFHIIHEKTRERCINPVEKVLATGNVIELANHTMLVARDGTQRIIADSGAPILDRQRGIVGVVLVFRDVTEESRLHDELQHMAKLDSLGVMAGGIAHDFNNLLTAIAGNMGLAQWALDADNPQKARHYVADAENAAMRARDLTQQLLTFSRGGAPMRAVIQPEPLIREAAAFALTGSRCRCHLEAPADVWPVFADAGQLSQVLHNLLLNADQAMPEGGDITVTIANDDIPAGAEIPLAPGAYVRIAVADGGIGIAPDIREKIFDPFFTTKQRGSGLGLASVYSIVRGHDGLVRVDSTPGKGSTFNVYIPAHRELPLPAAPDAEGPRAAAPWRVLILDDEPAICALLDDVLSAAGHSVVTAPNGAEAQVAWMHAYNVGAPFDLCILDLTIPGGMGGAELFAEMRAANPAVRAIASSGYADAPVMANYADHGFAGRLAKPYRPADVLRLIAELQKSGDSPNTVHLMISISV